jgi:hypothetical protein
MAGSTTMGSATTAMAGSSTTAGQMSMQPVDKIEVPAKGMVELKPGGFPLSAVVIGVARPDCEFVIPLGTAERLARGEQVFIMPNPLEVKVGQIISIGNDDDKAQLVGPFFVGPHQTMVRRFASPGTLQGACQIHPSGQLVVHISAG